MNIWIIAIAVLIFIVILLTIRLYLLKRAIKEINISMNNILNSDTNNLITISVTEKNIVELTKALNNELKELRKQVLKCRNGNKELEKTVTDISHDMRTPLTAINGYIDLIRKTKDTNKTQEYLKIIQRKTKDLIELTNQLFDYSKTLEMNVKIVKEKCCINEILEETLLNYYGIFKEKNIKPDIYICNEKIYKDIDKNTIVRAFENILSNVSKYSSGDFKAILDKDEKVIFSNKATSLDAISVQKIFNRYYTVENAKKSTGIGLSIAKQLIELNGGRISANYKENFLIIKIEL